MEIIQNNDWKLSIDLNGGRIAELIYKDELILGTFERIDGKQGNTHICCPNFGNEGTEIFGWPFHGPFRNLEWQIIDKSESKIEIEAIDLNLKIKQIFELKNEFNQKIIINNLSDKARFVNIAIHNYWASEFGWQTTKLNQEVVDNLIKSDLDQEILMENMLEIPGKRKYTWSLKGFNYGRFWTAFRKIESKKDYDQKYICIEPSLEKQGFINEQKNNLAAKDFLEVEQKIEIKI